MIETQSVVRFAEGEREQLRAFVNALLRSLRDASLLEPGIEVILTTRYFDGDWYNLDALCRRAYRGADDVVLTVPEVRSLLEVASYLLLEHPRAADVSGLGEWVGGVRESLQPRSDHRHVQER